MSKFRNIVYGTLLLTILSTIAGYVEYKKYVMDKERFPYAIRLYPTPQRAFVNTHGRWTNYE